MTSKIYWPRVVGVVVLVLVACEVFATIDHCNIKDYRISVLEQEQDVLMLYQRSLTCVLNNHGYYTKGAGAVKYGEYSMDGEKTFKPITEFPPVNSFTGPDGKTYIDNMPKVPYWYTNNSWTVDLP